MQNVINGRDPAGAFIAARAASPVWQLYDKPGMIQSKMSEISVDGSVNFQLRKGRHGVTSGDWEWFLNAADRVF